MSSNIALVSLLRGGLMISGALCLCLGSALARADTIFIDWHNSGDQDGSRGHPYQTVPQALAAAAPGDTISIETGSYTFQRRSLVFNTPATIRADGPVTISAASPQAPPPQTAYNHTYGIATHNSYWINRSDKADYFSSGTQELLSDQFLHEHVRAIEIDVHSEGAPDHQWKVYHTSDSGDFSCRYLSDCLEYLRNFHYAVPLHDVINVVVELKNTVAATGEPPVTFPGIPVQSNFNGTHTMEDFDAIFRNALASALYTPNDFLSDCGDITLRECAKARGWPQIDELRGKFIINILGNWSTAAYDWAQYAGQNIHSRAAFPMQSVLNLYPNPCNDVSGGLNPPATTRIDLKFEESTICIRDIDDKLDPSPFIDGRLRQAAFDESAFWQLEDLSDDALAKTKKFLEGNGIVRGKDSFEYEPDCTADAEQVNCQERRIKAGFQMIQTDYPWHFVNDGTASVQVPVDPSQRLKDPASLPDVDGQVAQYRIFNEPGTRVYFQTGPEWPGAWVYTNVPVSSDRWLETTVSSTRHGDTWGEQTDLGLGFLPVLNDYIKTCPAHSNPGSIRDTRPCTNYPRIAQEDGEGCIKVTSSSEADGIELCRQKNTTPGPSYYQESVDLYLRVYHNGRKSLDKQFRASRYAPCKRSADPNSSDVSDICIGSLIALAIKNFGESSTVTVYSAGKLGPSTSTPWLPEWNALHSEAFAMPMTKQGYRGWKSVLLVGLRMADQLNSVGTNDWRPEFTRLREITLEDLPNRRINFPSRVVDFSY